MPVPPTLSDLRILDLAAECRLLTRDVLAAATGVSYNLADRQLSRLSGRGRPYLRRSRRRRLPDGGRSSQWFTLRPEGAARMRALGSAWPDEALAVRRTQIERLHHERAAGLAPIDARAVEQAAVFAGVLLGAAEYPGAGFSVGDISPGEDLGLAVSRSAVRESLRRCSSPDEPDWKGAGEAIVPVTPAFHARLRCQGGTASVALLVFLKNDTTPASGPDLLRRVARACVLAPSIERDGNVGPYRYGVDCRVRLLVWFPSLAEETVFVEAARTLIGPELSRVWTTNGEALPLAGSGPKHDRHDPLWRARTAAAVDAWYQVNGGAVRAPLKSVAAPIVPTEA